MSISRCAQCFNRFSSHRNLPLILPSCLHHICSSCVSTSPNQGVQCRVHHCNQSSWQSKSLIAVDFHLLGHIIDTKENKFMLEQKHLDDSVAQFHFPLPHHISSSNLMCFKCKSSVSQVTCTFCMASFCCSCFTIMHRTPGLSTHTSVPYDVMDSFIVKTCIKHRKPIEFVGMEDFKLGCSHCAVYEDLKGKSVVDFNKFEKGIREDGIAKKSINKANDTIERLESAMKCLRSQSSLSGESALKNLELHLARCHRLLEVEGLRMKSQLKELEEEKLKSMEQLGTKIGQKMDKIGRLVEAAEWADSDKFNLIRLLEEMERMEEDDEVFEEFKGLKKPVVTIDQTILSSLTNHISISLENLAPISDPVRESRDSFKTLLTDLVVRLSEVERNRVEDKSVSNHLSGLENVVLRHVLSPENFYVMRTRDMKVEEIFKEMTVNVWNLGDRRMIKQGDMAVHKEGEKYSRVTVISVENEQAKVTFLDYGKTIHLSLSSLVSFASTRPFSFLSTCPPLAHHCTLDSVDSSTLWSDQAARAVEKFFGGQVCKLTVKGRRATTSQSIMMVNITREEDMNTISLLDYLMFKDLASRQKGDSDEKLIRPGKTFFPPPPVNMGTEYRVVVQQVDSHGDMHIMLMGENNTYAEFLVNMLEDLQVEYMVESEEDQTILMPRTGMVCVAKFSVDGKFYRARVMQVLRNRKLIVEFVDFGSCEVVEADDMRKINDKFMELPVMAVRVALADIKPVGLYWSEEAPKFIREKVRNREMRMLVMNKKKRNKTCKVLIYERNQNDSINYQLVMERYAIATKRMVKNEVVELISKKPEFDVNINIRSLCLLANTVEGTRTACRVVSAISPAKIHLRRLDQEQSFYQLSSALARHYHFCPVDSDLDHWQVGSYCVVKWDGEGWVRAIVLYKGDMELMYELLMIDYGVSDMMTTESMRPLTEQFCMPPYSCTVHLARLLPAGGGDDWTAAACEKLQDILQRTGIEVEVEVVGDMVDNSWPVVMYIQEKDDNVGPLDPLVYSYKSVGVLLMENGLAFPPRLDTLYQQAKMIVLDVIDKVADTHTDVFVDTVIQGLKVSTSFKWIPAVMPEKVELSCAVSHVDWDCNLFISTIPANQDMLKIIKSVLDIKYSGSFHSQEILQWNPGQACIAQFSLDKKWYRGEVLKVKDMGQCLVNFVDYGSEELCDVHSLRKGLFCDEFPIQCFTVQIYNVRPIRDKWEESTLDLLHQMLVDQVLKVTVAYASDTFPLQVRMVTTSGVDVGDMLVRNGYARKVKNIIDV